MHQVSASKAWHSERAVLRGSQCDAGSGPTRTAVLPSQAANLARDVESQESQRAGGGGDLVDGHGFVWTVGQAGVPRTIVDGRHAAEIGKQAQVAAVRRAPHRRLPTGERPVRG